MKFKDAIKQIGYTVQRAITAIDEDFDRAYAVLEEYRKEDECDNMYVYKTNISTRDIFKVDDNGRQKLIKTIKTRVDTCAYD